MTETSVYEPARLSTQTLVFTKKPLDANLVKFIVI